jgi:hypothetical protein
MKITSDPDYEGQLILCREAIFHVLNAICSDPKKYYLMGQGTESWEKLTRAAACLLDKPLEDVRPRYRPGLIEYERYLVHMEKQDELLEYCRRRGITAQDE